MSLGGFSLALAESLPIGSVHDFDLSVEGGARLVLRARVVHQAAAPQTDGSPAFLTGLQFIADLTPDVDLRIPRSA